jgi:hypothetical protein
MYQRILPVDNSLDKSFVLSYNSCVVNTACNAHTLSRVTRTNKVADENKCRGISKGRREGSLRERGEYLKLREIPNTLRPDFGMLGSEADAGQRWLFHFGGS